VAAVPLRWRNYWYTFQSFIILLMHIPMLRLGPNVLRMPPNGFSVLFVFVEEEEPLKHFASRVSGVPRKLHLLIEL
jgi:hypothetical protein